MERNVKLLALVAALALGGVVTAVEAREGKGRASFEDLDANGDGQVTLAEMQARGQARFATLDTDGDGLASRAELEAQGSERMKKRLDKMMERLDANGDGQLSQDEMQNGRDPSRRFARFDADNSGGLSKEEFEAIKKRMGKRKKQ